MGLRILLTALVLGSTLHAGPPERRPVESPAPFFRSCFYGLLGAVTLPTHLFGLLGSVQRLAGWMEAPPHVRELLRALEERKRRLARDKAPHPYEFEVRGWSLVQGDFPAIYLVEKKLGIVLYPFGERYPYHFEDGKMLTVLDASAHTYDAVKLGLQHVVPFPTAFIDDELSGKIAERSGDKEGLGRWFHEEVVSRWEPVADIVAPPPPKKMN